MVAQLLLFVHIHMFVCYSVIPESECLISKASCLLVTLRAVLRARECEECRQAWVKVAYTQADRAHAVSAAGPGPG